MSTVTVTIPQDYGYVIAATTACFAVGTWHGFLSGAKRRAAQTPYPRPYAFDNWTNDATTAQDETAKARYIFNCAQRAHGQFIEHLGIAVPSMLIAGIAYPRSAAVLGGLWAVNRVIYAIGYISAEKDKGAGRLIGSGYFLSEFGLMGLCAKMAFDLIMA